MQGRKDWRRPALQDVDQHERQREGGEAPTLPIVDAAAPRPDLPSEWSRCHVFSAGRMAAVPRKIRLYHGTEDESAGRWESWFHGRCLCLLGQLKATKVSIKEKGLGRAMPLYVRGVCDS